MSERSEELAKSSPIARLKALFRSPSFAASILLGIVVAALSGYASGFLAGYNEAPRIVLSQQDVAFIQDTLTKASKETGEAVQIIGIKNIPTEAQKKLLTSIEYIKFASKTLSERQPEPAIYFPRFSGLFTNAYAETLKPTEPIHIDAFREKMIIFVIGVITFFGVMCLLLYCFSGDAKKIEFSENMMRTIVGFYIGIVTGLFGLPPS